MSEPAKISVLISGRVEDAPGWLEARISDGGIRGIVVQVVKADETVSAMEFGEVYQCDLSLMGFGLQHEALYRGGR